MDAQIEFVTNFASKLRQRHAQPTPTLSKMTATNCGLSFRWCCPPVRRNSSNFESIDGVMLHTHTYSYTRTHSISKICKCSHKTYEIANCILFHTACQGMRKKCVKEREKRRGRCRMRGSREREICMCAVPSSLRGPLGDMLSSVPLPCLLFCPVLSLPAASLSCLQ